jgi:hypothetical protein
MKKIIFIIALFSALASFGQNIPLQKPGTIRPDCDGSELKSFGGATQWAIIDKCECDGLDEVTQWIDCDGNYLGSSIVIGGCSKFPIYTIDVVETGGGLDSTYWTITHYLNGTPIYNYEFFDSRNSVDTTCGNYVLESTVVQDPTDEGTICTNYTYTNSCGSFGAIDCNNVSEQDTFPVDITVTQLPDDEDSTYTEVCIIMNYGADICNTTGCAKLELPTDVLEVTTENEEDDFYTATHTAVDGTVQSFKIPKCVTYLGSETGEIVDIECDRQIYDITSNDGDCTKIVTASDGVTSTTASYIGTYKVKEVRITSIDAITGVETDITNISPPAFDVTLDASGVITLYPRDCSMNLRIEVDNCIDCNGTLSNTVTDVFNTVASPVGSILPEKQVQKFDDKGNLVEVENVLTGDQLVMTLEMCSNGTAPNPDGSPLGPVDTPYGVDQLNPCYGNPTFLSANTTSGGTVDASHFSVTGQTIELGADLTGNPLPTLQSGECHVFRFVVDVVCPSGFGIIPNSFYVEGDGNGDGTNGDTYGSDVEVVGEVDLPITSNEITDVDYGIGEFTIEETFTKEPSGSLAPIGATYKRTFKKKSDGTIISETTGALGANDDTWTGVGIGDITPYIQGGTGNGQPIVVEKSNAATALGLVDANADEWIVCIQYGGNSDPLCPIASNIDTVELCRVTDYLFENENLRDNTTSTSGGVLQLSQLYIGSLIEGQFTSATTGAASNIPYANFSRYGIPGCGVAYIPNGYDTWTITEVNGVPFNGTQTITNTTNSTGPAYLLHAFDYLPALQEYFSCESVNISTGAFGLTPCTERLTNSVKVSLCNCDDDEFTSFRIEGSNGNYAVFTIGLLSSY